MSLLPVLASVMLLAALTPVEAPLMTTETRMRVLSKRFSADIADHYSLSANHRHHPRGVATRGVLAKYPSNAPDLTGTTGDFSIDNRGHLFDNDMNRLAQAGITTRLQPPLHYPNHELKGNR